jgi:uncharacterized cupin superfamily protein
MSESLKNVVNADQVEEQSRLGGEHFGAHFKVLTPAMRELGGKLGVNLMRVPPGRTTCPFHTHQLEDEVFFILSGTGVLRYGDAIISLKQGDCVSCPAGTKTAHQIANNGDEDLVYLAIGDYNPDEVCTYPDSDKVMVRSLGRVGRFEATEYLAHEPEEPRIFELAKEVE